MPIFISAPTGKLTTTLMTHRFTSGVSFDPDVLEYLQLLGEQHQRPRSFIINAIVREHAQRTRDKKPSPVAVIKL